MTASPALQAGLALFSSSNTVEFDGSSSRYNKRGPDGFTVVVVGVGVGVVKGQGRKEDRFPDTTNRVSSP